MRLNGGVAFTCEVDREAAVKGWKSAPEQSYFSDTQDNACIETTNNKKSVWILVTPQPAHSASIVTKWFVMFPLTPELICAATISPVPLPLCVGMLE